MSGVLHAYGCVHDRHLPNGDPRFSDLTAELAVRTFPPRADLVAYAVPVYDQGQLGSCTANGEATMYRIARRVAGLPDVDLSRLWLYQQELLLEHDFGQDVGAQPRDGMLTLGTYGCPPEVDWPYDLAQFTVRPPVSLKTAAHANRIESFHRVNGLTELKQAILLKKPVGTSIQVFDSFESTQANATGTIPLPNVDTEQRLGGHFIVAVGYDDTRQQVRFQNSWNTTWGDGGYGTLPYGYFDPRLGILMGLLTLAL